MMDRVTRRDIDRMRAQIIGMNINCTGVRHQLVRLRGELAQVVAVAEMPSPKDTALSDHPHFPVLPMPSMKKLSLGRKIKTAMQLGTGALGADVVFALAACEVASGGYVYAAANAVIAGIMAKVLHAGVKNFAQLKNDMRMMAAFEESYPVRIAVSPRNLESVKTLIGMADAKLLKKPNRPEETPVSGKVMLQNLINSQSKR